MGNINKNRNLDIYKEDFEIPYKNQIIEYYSSESSNYISMNGVSAYLKKVEERIEEEEIRNKKLLDPSSFDPIKKEIYHILIDKHKNVIHSEFENYLRDNKKEGKNIFFIEQKNWNFFIRFK